MHQTQRGPARLHGLLIPGFYYALRRNRYLNQLCWHASESMSCINSIMYLISCSASSHDQSSARGWALQKVTRIVWSLGQPFSRQDYGPNAYHHRLFVLDSHQSPETTGSSCFVSPVTVTIKQLHKLSRRFHLS